MLTQPDPACQSFQRNAAFDMSQGREDIIEAGVSHGIGVCSMIFLTTFLVVTSSPRDRGSSRITCSIVRGAIAFTSSTVATTLSIFSIGLSSDNNNRINR